MVRPRLSRCFGSSVVTLALAGCGTAEEPRCATAECEQQRFFNADAGALLDCEGAVRVELDARVDVEVLYSSALALGDVARLTRAAATYYAAYGLSFRLLGTPEAHALGPPIAGSRAEIDRALADAGLPADGELNAEQAALADALVAEIVLAPLRALMHERALPRRPLVSFVVLERLAEPSLVAEGVLPPIDGLGLSPELLERLRASGGAAGSFDALELPAEFTPTLFLDVAALARFEHPDNVVAHELGHALGLLHTDEPGNLMQPEVAESCRAWLSKEQAVSLAESAWRASL